MRAAELLRESGELKHKVRTVSDLVNHLATREEGDSNYSLLLGSGASITSGIRTASDLIKVWKKDLYARLADGVRSDQPNEADVDYFFSSQCASWFNPANPYSSLFEKRYDLPSQRRRFIEKEVDGRLPSIGYAYLTAIMDAGFINTVFTTNFDDLLNEAFYHFSNKRPIHCAHDSSVHSISITSKRPKIIKLHGDYLFDDIKSTLRETESLEQNIRDKMIELCKEYGLIVLGYSGSDRSVMDVLDFLIKQENYLKNGIYWCLRPDDEVNHQLLNLLWKDRVYPVIIDGFDEFFAEAHSVLVSSYLDVENNIKQSKVRKTIEEIVKDRSSLSDNNIISRDIEAIKQINVRSDIGKFIDGPDSDVSGLSIYDVRNLMEVDSYLRKGELDQAGKVCEEFKSSAVEQKSVSSYIRKLIEISNKQGNSAAAIRWCSELLGLDEFDVGSHLLMARFKHNPHEKFSYYNGLVKRICHSPKLYLETARSGFKLLKMDYNGISVSLDDLLSYVDVSIELEPSMANEAWSLKYDMLQYKERIGSEKDLVESFVDQIYKNFPFSINAHRIRGGYLASRSDYKELKKVIESLRSMHSCSSISRQSSIDSCMLNLVDSVILDEEDEEALSLLNDFFESHKVQKESAAYYIAKANYELGVKKDIDIARSYFDKAKSSFEFEDVLQELFEFEVALESILDNSRKSNPIDFDFYLDVLDGNKHNLIEDYYFVTRFNMLVRSVQFAEAETCLDKAFDCGLSLDNYIVNKTYLYLIKKEYERCIDFSEEYGKVLDGMDDEARFPVIVNREFAKKKLGRKIDQTALMNIVANSGKKSAKVCALRILGRDGEAKKIARNKVELNGLSFAHYQTWPVLQESFLNEINPYK